MKLSILELPLEVPHRIVGCFTEPWIPLPIIGRLLRKKHPIGLLEARVTYRWKDQNNDHYIMHINPGFRWDGASLPPAVQKVIGKPFSSSWLKGALAHDALYMSRLTDRGMADYLFGLIMHIEDPKNNFDGIMEFAVRAFGEGPWDDQSLDDRYNAQFVQLVKIPSEAVSPRTSDSYREMRGRR